MGKGSPSLSDLGFNFALLTAKHQKLRPFIHEVICLLVFFHFSPIQGVMRCGLSKQNWDTRSDKNLVDLSFYLYIYVRAHILLRSNVITYPPCIMSQQVTRLRAPHILTMHGVIINMISTKINHHLQAI